jgi:hypothetical protein
MKRRLAQSACLCLVGLAAGCGTAQVRISELRLETRTIATGLPKRKVPVYIIAEPTTAPDVVVTPAVGIMGRPIEIYDLKTFVLRDVASIFGKLFESVAVVDDQPAKPSGPCLIVHVRLDRFVTEDARRPTVDPAGTIRGVLDWTVTIESSDRASAPFTFKDRVEGQGSTIGEEVIKTTLEAALRRLCNGLGELKS